MRPGLRDGREQREQRDGRDMRERGGFEVRSSRFSELRTQNFELQIAPFSFVSLLLFLQNGEAHRAHQAHLVDLFSNVNFHFVSAGFPCVL